MHAESQERTLKSQEDTLNKLMQMDKERDERRMKMLQEVISSVITLIKKD